MHETNCYGRWAQEASGDNNPFEMADDPDALRASGRYVVLTPDECVEMAHKLGDLGDIQLHPLMGGMPPDLSWPSLELFADKVFPQLEIDTNSVFAIDRI